MNLDLKIVLISPDIPGNTGSIGRSCVALGIELILIRPLGFDIDEKAVRRAGLDYWKHLKLKVYENWNEFLEKESPEDLLFFENPSSKNFYQAPYKKSSYLIFGSETKGISKEILDKNLNKIYDLPMYSKHIRSLNLSNTVTAVAYEALGSLLDARS